jgi:hypothetical protein
VVVLYVERGEVEEERIVLELTESAVAVEAQQGSDGAGLVVAIQVLCRRRAADGAESALLLQHGVSLLGADPVPPREAVRATTAPLGDSAFASLVVAGPAVRSDARRRSS